MAQGAGDGRGRLLAWVGHPGTLAAVVVLAVNDHVLKQALPGLLTGKLSDVAGLMVAPPLLALLLGVVFRRGGDRVAQVALWATGVGFGLVKVSATGAGAASWLWSLVVPSHMVADPTDLLALPALAVSWRLWTLARRGRPTSRRVRLARVLVAVPFAVLATAATSTLSAGPSRAVSIGSRQGQVLLSTTGMSPNQQLTLWSTGDGGSSWRQVPLPPGVGYAPFEPPVTSVDCVPGQPSRCYRAVSGGNRVEQSSDAGVHWSTAWELSPGRVRFLHREQHHYLIGDDGPTSYQVTSLVVVGVADGYRVIVADDGGGLVVGDSAGRWVRQGFPMLGPLQNGSRPLPETGFGQHIWVEWALAVLGALFTLLASVAATAIPRRGRAIRAVAHGGVGWRVLRRLRVGGVLAVVAFGTGAAIILPFLGWTVARPDSYTVATGLAVAGLLCGLVGGCLLGRRMAVGQEAAADSGAGPGPSDS